MADIMATVDHSDSDAGLLWCEHCSMTRYPLALVGLHVEWLTLGQETIESPAFQQKSPLGHIL